MKTFKIAWRNIWRNKRRTLITMASVCAAVFFALIMRGFQEGTYDRAIYNLVNSYTGHMQIHANGYQDSQSIDDAFEYDDSVKQIIGNIKGIESTMLQLSSGAAAYNAQFTKFAMIIAGDPEDALGKKVQENIIFGEPVTINDRSVLLSEGLANYLRIITYDTVKSVVDGDTIEEYNPRMLTDSVVLMGQGMYGQSANALYKVKGIIKYPNPDLNKRVIYMPLPLAQEYLSAENMITSIALILKSDDLQDEVYKEVKSIFKKPDYEVLSWQSMNEELVQQIESDKGSGMLIIFILYLIIGFGIFGTIVMMTAERKKEFAVMIALGMKRKKLKLQFTIEMLYMGVIGVFSGFIIVTPVLLYFIHNPIRYTGEMAKMIEDFGFEAIMTLSIKSEIFITHGIIVFVLFIISSMYTRRQIKTLDVIKSIRS